MVITLIYMQNETTESYNMKTITYNNKQYKLPFDVELPEDPTAEVEVALSLIHI